MTTASSFTFRFPARRLVATGIAALCAAFGAGSASAIDFARVQDFNIPAQPLSTALLRFSEQAQVQVVVESQLVESLDSPPVQGNSTPLRALETLLRDTGLRYTIVGTDAVAIRGAENGGGAAPVLRTTAETRAVMISMQSGGVSTPAASTAQASRVLVAQAGGEARTGNRSAAPEAPRSADGLEEIVITARSRDEDLFEAPLSITGISAAEIERTNIRDIASLSQQTPGFYYTAQNTFTGSRVTPAFRFRGINNGSAAQLQQLGGIFVDGVYLFGGAQSLTMDDIERVEVIKGPQSALFGRGTFSGAVNFITREPSDTLSFRGSAGVETEDTHALAMSAEGPIGDALSFRISGSKNQKGAHFHANDGGEFGRERTDAVAAQLVWKPVDGLRLRLRHSEAWQDDSRHGVVFLNANRPLLLGAKNRCQTGLQPYFCGELPTIGSAGTPEGFISVSTALVTPVFATSNNPNLVPDVLNNNLDNALVIRGLPYITETPHLDHIGLEGRFTRTAFESGYEFEGGASLDLVVSNSKFRATSANSASDDRGNGINIATNVMRDKSADLRLRSGADQRLTWLIGANYFRQESLGGEGGTGAVASVNELTNAVSYVEPTVFADQARLESRSVFGALGFKITPQLSFDVEGRYVMDDVTNSIGLATETTEDYENFTPRVILTWQPVEDLTLYASWAQAALPGLTNSNTALFFPDIEARVRAYPGYVDVVPDEKLDNYEIGIKQKLDRVRYAVTAYHMDWTNLKDNVFTQCRFFVACGNTVITPFARTTLPTDAKISGFEAEIDAVVAPGWNVSASAAYNNAEYDDYFSPLAVTATGQTSGAGKRIYGFPSVQGTLSSGYTRSVSTDWSGFVNGEVLYTGKIYVDEINQAYIGDAARVNLRFGAEREDLRIEAYVENVFNDKTWLSGARANQSFQAPGAAFAASEVAAAVVLPRLRTYGVRVRLQFE